MANFNPHAHSVVVTRGVTPCGQEFCEMELVAEAGFIKIEDHGGHFHIGLRMTDTELWKLGATLQEMARKLAGTADEVNHG